ncbi:hypothetical protein BV22DRAFT_1095901 [Leucogyrophana mollusca]|uniref:Uncharacterized protein n=1 Tax=Leucogyrophana mollusca TaxID=85980 RepID=A0ACB8B7Y2_9AGAM|nr:hypothetical protein BV22DRAFT_1095901 [Leucogyrophana mollusca]
MAFITDTGPPPSDSSNRQHADGGQSGIGADTQSQHLLQQILQTLKESSIAQQSGNDPKSRFWATYKREAEDYDSEFLEKYKDDMDIVLIFSGLFSAVSTTFITSMQSSFSADPTATTNVLLMQLIHTANTTAFADQNFDLPANGPGSTVIWVQSLIYASLSASLLAALGAVLGKQWLGHYRRRGTGTVDERAMRRQQKLNSFIAWHFHAVLEVLPVLLQISLLLFGVALSAFVWTEQTTVGAVVIGTMALGILFYISITVASLISPDCPFQTPPSTIIAMIREAFWRPLLRYFRDKARNAWEKREGAVAIVLLPAFFVYQYFRRFRRFLAAHQTVFQVGPFWRMVTHRGAPVDFGLTALESSPASVPLPQTPLKLEIPVRSADKLAVPAIVWLIETSTDPEVIATAARMVPDVEWPVELDILPAYLQLCDAFMGCFVSIADTSGGWQLAPLGQERALACGKALVHLYCNRSYLKFKPYWRGGFWHPRLFHLFACLRRNCYDRSTAFICDIGVLLFSGRHDRFPQVPDTCRTWVSHLLPPLLSVLAGDEVRQMAVEATIGLVTRPFPPRKILADCLLSAAIVMGIDVDKRELVKFDKGLVCRSIIRLGHSISSLSTVQWLRCCFDEPCRFYQQHAGSPKHP